MKDKRGVDIKEGQTIIFARSTGSFGGHEVTEGKVVKICPKTITVGYTNWNGKYKEGNYYPHSFMVVDSLPTPDINTQLKTGDIIEVMDWDIDNLIRVKVTSDTYEEDDDLYVDFRELNGRPRRAMWDADDFRWEC